MSNPSPLHPSQPARSATDALKASTDRVPHVPHGSVGMVPCGPIRGKIRVPGSKSLTNRALVIAAMANGPSRLSGVLASDDTAVMIDSLRRIGTQVVETKPTHWTVMPGDRIDDSPVEMSIGNSGTSIRFLTAMLSARGGRYRLSGVPRMHARPIGDLINALRPIVLGDIHAESDGNCPPVQIDSKGWNAAAIEVGGGVSSQYLSGLMMAAGGIQDDSQRRISILGELVSRPYVEMTAAIMHSFGGEVKTVGSEWCIRGRGYHGTDYSIEPDASAASYFWAAAAITGGRVNVLGLTTDALQGDIGVVNVLQQMGCSVESDSDGITVTGGDLHGVDVDMNAISDTVQTIAPVALFADGPTRIRGVAHNRFKETDRIGDLARELRKFGSEIVEHEDGLTIHPITDLADPPTIKIETYDDHRMAMGMSLSGLRRGGVWIENPSCTAKTYPEFFADLESLVGHGWRWTDAANA